ncbi:MAG: phosphoprotein phosphatase [Herbaspirillum sp.]|nr:phosphoprotein phosphatase [Herbaspirillum sp.]
MIEHYEINTAGRDLIVGDIHGYFTRLQACLDGVGFDPAIDRLFSVGDLVDRGPESRLALEWLEKPWFHAIAGNHEDMAIRFPNGNMDAENYIANGGGWNVANTDWERIQFADAFAALPIAIELETAGGLIGIVHADCPMSTWGGFIAELRDPNISKSRRRALIDSAQWSRARIESSWSGGVPDVRAVVVGHTPLLQFTSLGNVLYIDTGGWFPENKGGNFTLLDAATLQPARQIEG